MGFAELAQRAGELLAQLPKSGFRRGWPRRYHEIKLSWNLG